MSKDGAVEFGRYLANAIANSAYDNPTDFARDASVSPSSISRYIAGKERPSLRVLERIAAKLPKVAVSDLIAIAYPEGSDEAPVVEVVEIHALAREIGRMLADNSPIPSADRDALETILDRVVDPYRRLMKRRRSA